ncbi:MAG: maltooligosyltrehalose trehalohydrolase [Acidimicrobiaceae bacterium]|nr:maltooligosyltrehalose trehalohydrolase [Acidimicrobiaceae bacterium]
MAHRFTVWAPLPSRVEVVIGDRRSAMAPVTADPGWWAADVEEAGPGTDYAFSLDGGPPRPDPRTAWQPAGVDGPSRLVDHGAFEWHDELWRGLYLPSAVLYELHVGTFTPAGTFDAAIERLDHLVSLGVDGIELLPVAAFSGERGWGYDGVDLFAPHDAYGGPEGLKRLVDACHARGIGVVMDVVYNHLGPSGNYLAEYGPYFTDRHNTNWGPAVNFDDAWSSGARAFVVDNALMWLHDYHCDGLRLDAVHAFKDDSARHILEELADAVHWLAAHERRPLFLIAESDLNDPHLVRSRDAGGYGVDAVWADEFHHALHAALTGERDGYYADFGSLAQVAKALRDAWVFTGEYSVYRKRVHGRPAPMVGGEHFIVFLHNHDQVGNRAVGDRKTHMEDMTLGRAKIGAALTVLAPFVPMLFQGEEWAASAPFMYFTDHQDPALGNAVSEGRRREFASFGWAPEDIPDPQEEGTFLRSKLRWDEVESPDHAAMLAWYTTVISLRRRMPALSDGRRGQVRTAFDSQLGWLVMARGPVTVAVNLGAQTVTVPASPASPASPATPAAPAVDLLAASEPGVVLKDGAIVLPPDSVAVVMTGEAEERSAT